MKTFNILYEDDSSICDFVRKHNLQDCEHLLVRIHTSIHTIDTIRSFLSNLRLLLPKAVLIGSSNIAVINDGNLLYDQCLLAFSDMGDAIIKGGCFSTKGKDAYTLGLEVKNSQITCDAQSAFAFMTSTNHNISSFMDEYNTYASDVVTLGGIACIDEVFGKDFVFYQEEVQSDALVLASITDTNLTTVSGITIGAEKIGQSYTITKMDGIYIDEIDEKNATEWYQNLLGKEVFMKDPSISKIFPFILPNHHDTIRTIFYDEEQNRIHFEDQVHNGEPIRLGYHTPSVVVNECQELCQRIEATDVESLFAYTCHVRSTIMNRCSSWELAPFKGTRITGALCGGEIGYCGDRNEYSNCSCCFLGLAQKPHRMKLDLSVLDQADNLHYDNQHILTYLLKSMNEDMYQTNRNLNQKLIDQNNQLLETLFVDEHTHLPNLSKFLYDHEHLKFDKLALITIQNANMLRSHYGDEICNKELCNKIERCRQFLKDDNLYYYQKNQDSIILAALDEYDDHQFIKKMKSLFTYLGTIDAREVGFYYVNEFAVVAKETDLLEKAELTLTCLEQSTQRFLLYYPTLGLESEVSVELQCLSNIKDALLHNRVIPYFQAIHDNKTDKIQKFESLMRLETADGEILFPNDFLGIAKKYRLYTELSQQMIAKVMMLFEDSPYCVTINLSVQDIYSQSTKTMIYRQLEKMAHPENIVFEIVESEEIHKDNVLAAFIREIRVRNAKIAIDDFGSGYSNLLKLIKLNADYIKIDGEIVRNIIVDEMCHTILDTILFLSDKTKTELIAEYVENAEIQKEVKRLGIRYSQGYHFAKPMPYWEVFNKECV